MNATGRETEKGHEGKRRLGRGGEILLIFFLFFQSNTDRDLFSFFQSNTDREDIWLGCSFSRCFVEVLAAAEECV